MKAWLCHDAGGPDSLVLGDVPEPSPGYGQVLIRVEAVGINYRDALLVRGKYQMRPPRPFVPGGELCGVIEAVGAGVTKFRRGDQVIALCKWGALAQKVVTDEERCLPVPVDTPPATAAAFLFAYASAYHALRDAGNIVSGETMLVLGAAGAVGAAAVEIGCALGARVLAAVSSERKRMYALARGATQAMVYPAEVTTEKQHNDLAAAFKEIAGPQGVDLVLDPVGGAYSEAALRAISPNGRFLVMGFPAGIPKMPLNLPLLKGCSIVGVDWYRFLLSKPEGHRENVKSLLALWREGRIQPEVAETFDMQNAPKAIALLEQRQATGKVVVTLDA